MTHSGPPRIPQGILRAALPDSHATDVIEDLAHAYRKCLDRGWSRPRAQIWYWGQLLLPDTFRLVYLLRTRRRVGHRTPGPGEVERRRGSEKPGLNALGQDLRFASRAIRRSPGFTILVLLTLALGVGANTAIFSAVYGVLLKPLPYADSHRLIRIRELEEGQFDWSLSPPNFMDLQEEATSLEGVAAYRGTSLTLTGRGTPEQIPVVRVSAGFFELLGVPPALGRSFLPEEDVAGAPPTVILTHGAWQRRFGGDPEILDQEVALDGVQHTVVGVTAPDFRFGSDDTEVWLPHGFSERDLTLRGRHFLQVLARLSPDVELAEAREEMSVLWARLEESYPETNAGWGIMGTPLLDSIVGRARTPLLLLLGSVGLVLLIACANVIHLSLARADRREGEIAIRSAMGASQGRLLRQHVMEHLLLGLGGGALGLAVALGTAGPFLALLRTHMPRVDDIGVDGSVLLFTLLISLAVGALTALVPITRGPWGRPADATRPRDPRVGRTIVRGRARGAFVVSEVALSMILVMGTGLLLNSFIRLMRVDLGFETEGVLTGEISLPGARYSTDEERAAFFQSLTDELERHGEVRSAGAVGVLPLWGNYTHVFSGVGDREEEEWDAEDRLVTSGYFETMGIPVLAGRAPERTDDANAPGVALLNEALARRMFPDETAVGKRMKMAGFSDEESWEVIGVVGNTRQFGAREAAPLTVYRPHSQFRPPSFMAVVVRASGSPLELAVTVTEAVNRLDPTLPVSRISTMEELVAESLAPDRVLLLMVGLFGLVAVLLGAVGIFGVMSYTVSQRTREIGVRIAMGGAPVDVLKMIIMKGMTLVGLGLGLGLLGSAAAGRALTGVLFGVRPTDPTTLLTAAGVITLVAFAACLIPAVQAAAVDPAVSLREE